MSKFIFNVLSFCKSFKELRELMSSIELELK